jgi:hypothetical protein
MYLNLGVPELFSSEMNVVRLLCIKSYGIRRRTSLIEREIIIELNFEESKHNWNQIVFNNKAYRI